VTKAQAVIGGWLSDAEGGAFVQYAAEIGIDSAALATLLLVRELSEDGLCTIRTDGRITAVQKERRITARTVRHDLKERFRAHAAKHGLSSDAAAAAIFRTELGERWLGKCLGLTGESG
jgi:hypothetical protein